MSRCHSRLLLVVLLSLATLWATSPQGRAASLAEQRRELNRASTALRTATRMLSAERHDDAADAIEQAQTTLKELSQGLEPKLKRQFERVAEQLAETHAELKRAGVKVPELATFTITEASDTPGLGPRGGPPAGDQISFSSVVAPILVSKCGGCHIDRSQGGFSMASYNALMRGGRGGKVIEVGSGAESRMIDLIASGSMPPNGNVVTPQEARQLVRWINQGAKFDGDDPDKSLRQVRAGAGTPSVPAPAERPKVAIREPKGDETVSFSLDVAPLLTASCVECHGGANPGAMLSLASFEQLWKGGNNGSAIVPGKPAESLLVQKLKGTAAEGQRMPLNRPAWDADKIALVEKWISEGASFDGSSPAESLARVTAILRADRSTSEELSALRRTEAEQQWRLALPDEPASAAQTPRLLLMGNLPKQQLEELGQLAETEADRVLKLFAQSDQPLNKSRVTLFVFRHRIDYSEFGTMVERRDLGGNDGAHARFDLVHPYAAVVAAPGDPESQGRAVAQVLGELYIAGEARGRLPEWFAAGTGRAVAARLWPKDELVAKWKADLPGVVASLSSPEAFMTGKLPPATSDVASFGFVDTAIVRPGNVLKWARQIGEGQSLDEAAQSVFRRDTKQLAEIWAASVTRRGR